MNTSNFVSIPASMFEDQEILVFENQRLTYGQLWSNIQRLANALRALGRAAGRLCRRAADELAPLRGSLLCGGGRRCGVSAAELSRQAARAGVHGHHGAGQGAHRRRPLHRRGRRSSVRSSASVQTLRGDGDAARRHAAPRWPDRRGVARARSARGRRRGRHHPDVHQRHDRAAEGGDADVQRFHRLRHRQRRDGRRHAARHLAAVRAALPHRRRDQRDDQHVDRPQAGPAAPVRCRRLAAHGRARAGHPRLPGADDGQAAHRSSRTSRSTICRACRTCRTAARRCRSR